MYGRKSLTLYEGMTGMLENDFLNVKNTSFSIVAEIDSGDTPANGVILSQGGRFGGWSLYVMDGKPVYTYNYVGIDVTDVTATAMLPKGKSTVKLDFAYEGGDKLGQGGTATITIDGKKVGSGNIPATEFAIFSADEGASVGMDQETTVSPSYDLSLIHI